MEGLLENGISAEGNIAEKELLVKGAVKCIIEELYMIARKEMFKSQLVFAHLGGAARGIEEVLSGIENRRRGQAHKSAIYTLSQLNKAVIELLRVGSPSQGSGAGSRKKMQMMLKQRLKLLRKKQLQLRLKQHQRKLLRKNQQLRKQHLKRQPLKKQL